MFAARFFNVRFYAARYFPKLGGSSVVIGPTPAERLAMVSAEVRRVAIEQEVRSVPIPPEPRRVVL